MRKPYRTVVRPDPQCACAAPRTPPPPLPPLGASPISVWQFVRRHAQNCPQGFLRAHLKERPGHLVRIQTGLLPWASCYSRGMERSWYMRKTTHHCNHVLDLLCDIWRPDYACEREGDPDQRQRQPAALFLFCGGGLKLPAFYMPTRICWIIEVPPVNMTSYDNICGSDRIKRNIVLQNKDIQNSCCKEMTGFHNSFCFILEKETFLKKICSHHGATV